MIKFSITKPVRSINILPHERLQRNQSLHLGRITDYDLDLWHRHLADFIPPDVFDAHAHLWRTQDLGTPTPALAAAGPALVTREVYDERLPSGCRTVVRPAVSFPISDPRPRCRGGEPPPRRRNAEGSGFARPHDRDAASGSGRRVERQIDDDGFVGFKVYHLFAERTDTLFAPTGEFIPEWAWELADQRGLAIMLHMVLPRAVAEPENQRYIREHCRRYPNAKLILAHAARGFCGRHTVEGIASLRGIDNVFFDTSAVCEASAFEAILEVFGPTRLWFGADFCVTEMRSRCVNLADGFLWLERNPSRFLEVALRPAHAAGAGIPPRPEGGLPQPTPRRDRRGGDLLPRRAA